MFFWRCREVVVFVMRHTADDEAGLDAVLSVCFYEVGEVEDSIGCLVFSLDLPQASFLHRRSQPPREIFSRRWEKRWRGERGTAISGDPAALTSLHLISHQSTCHLFGSAPGKGNFFSQPQS